MHTIKIPAREFFDEETQTFLSVDATELHLEHSLLSVSKWESKWTKPFLSKEQMTAEETLDYIRCMCIEEVDDLTLSELTPNDIQGVTNYINAKMTATWFTDLDDNKSKKNGRVTTSELIYCWMFSLQIPIECERWHLNRLLTLIRVCNEENNPDKKKMSKRQIMSQNQALNAARRKALHSKG